MIAAWLLYALGVGALLAGGALALEHVLRSHGRPARGVWIAALLGSVLWPLTHWTLSHRPVPAPLAAVQAPVAPALDAGPAPAVSLPRPAALAVGPRSLLRRLDGPILVVWALTSALLAVILTALVVRTRRLRRRWAAGELGGHPVLLSDDWGPAVVGLLRPRVVLPRWCADLDARTLRFVLDHELEHIRAGDLRRLLLMGVLPVLFPWHLALWWQWARLRAAVEGDCDLRVLRRHPGQTRPYIDLLLALGHRSAGPRPLAALLSEPYDTLKRRIRIMTMPLPTRPWMHGGLRVGAALALVAAACVAPPPTDATDDDPAADPVLALDGAEMASNFTPYSVLPELRNRAAVAEAIGGIAVDAGEPASAEVWFFVTENGRVSDTRISRSSGSPDLDRAVLEAAGDMVFTVALNRDEKRAVWVEMPVRFVTSDAEAEAAAVEIEPRVVTRPSAEPVAIGDERGTVEGVVVDATSGRPLPHVQLFVPGSRAGGLSDDQGRFRIDGVPTGAREFVAYVVGYEEVGTPISLDPDGTTELRIELRATAIPVEPLVVRLGGR